MRSPTLGSTGSPTPATKAPTQRSGRSSLVPTDSTPPKLPFQPSTSCAAPHQSPAPTRAPLRPPDHPHKRQENLNSPDVCCVDVHYEDRTDRRNEVIVGSLHLSCLRVWDATFSGCSKPAVSKFGDGHRFWSNWCYSGRCPVVFHSDRQLLSDDFRRPLAAVILRLDSRRNPLRLPAAVLVRDADLPRPFNGLPGP